MKRHGTLSRFSLADTDFLSETWVHLVPTDPPLMISPSEAEDFFQGFLSGQFLELQEFGENAGFSCRFPATLVQAGDHQGEARALL